MDRRKLLIADDSEMNRAMLANMLDHDFQIIEAVDGHETISALEMYEGEIAALLLDIVMPEMDGFQVLEEMQRRGCRCPHHHDLGGDGQRVYRPCL